MEDINEKRKQIYDWLWNKMGDIRREGCVYSKNKRFMAQDTEDILQFLSSQDVVIKVDVCEGCQYDNGDCDKSVQYLCESGGCPWRYGRGKDASPIVPNAAVEPLIEEKEETP